MNRPLDESILRNKGDVKFIAITKCSHVRWNNGDQVLFVNTEVVGWCPQSGCRIQSRCRTLVSHNREDIVQVAVSRTCCGWECVDPVIIDCLVRFEDDVVALSCRQIG